MGLSCAWVGVKESKVKGELVNVAVRGGLVRMRMR